ncbi:MAG: hypothetical protein J6M56_03955 [Clostridia bacterium]|nr:hypothetical protein [Clostridia bacterium]
MRRIDVNREMLERMYAPMDERFERNLRAMIDTLPQRREKRRSTMKPRYALAFALLLIALAATALAAYMVSQGFFAEVATLEAESGYYEHWTLEEKERLAASMKAYGILKDTALWDEALSTKSEAKREKALDRLFAQRYGVNGRTDTITAAGIIEKEMGVYDNEWSLEDKARYAAILMEFDLLGYDTNVDLLPGEDDIAQEEAVRLAREAVLDAYSLEENELDGYRTCVHFWEHRTEIGVKPPYYLIEMACPEKTSYYVYVSGDGRILSTADGYKGVESPWEDAARMRRMQEAEQTGMDQLVQAHVAGLETLPVRRFERGGMVKTLSALADGTVLLTGLRYDGNNDAEEVFAESIDAAGQTVWRAAYPVGPKEDVALSTAMQLESGDILVLVERRRWLDRDTLAYQYSEQLRISAQGELLEALRLQPIAALTGQERDFDESMFGVPGHGGLLVSGAMGPKHQKFYAQLDEQGRPRFVFNLSELSGYAPYLLTTEDGYVLTAWNEAADMPILRFYDKQGNLLSEDAQDEALRGLRINRVTKAGEGRYAVTSGFMKDGEWVLAFIDDSGRLLEKHVRTFASGPILKPSEIAKVGERYAYACRHWIERDVVGAQHLGLIVWDADTGIQEYHMRDERLQDALADDIIAGLYAAALGEGQLMLAYTEGTDVRRDYKTTLLMAETVQ